MSIPRFWEKGPEKRSKKAKEHFGPVVSRCMGCNKRTVLLFCNRCVKLRHSFHVRPSGFHIQSTLRDSEPDGDE